MTLYHPMEGLSLSPRFCSSTVRKHPLPKRGQPAWVREEGEPGGYHPGTSSKFANMHSKREARRHFEGINPTSRPPNPPDAPSTRTATPRTRTAPQWFTNPTKILTPLVGRGTKTPMAGRNSIGRFGKFAACELELMFHSFFSRHDKHCDCVTLVRSILPLNPMVKCECAAWSSLPHHLDAAMAGNYQQGEGW